MTPVLADTGFLVALFDPADRDAANAAIYLREHRHPLATVTAVVVEACFFLSAARKAAFLRWVRSGAMTIVDVPVAAYAQLEATLLKYADRDIDLADAALVWLANEGGMRRILTVDRGDFALFRLKNGRRFELIDWS